MKNKIVLSEYAECLLLVDYLNILKAQGKIVAYTHIPNETYTTSWSVKRKNKALGVAKGFPDYIIILSGIPGKLLFIEMKKEKGGVISGEQSKWLIDLSYVPGAVGMVCHGFEAARQMINKELEAQLQKL